ncbi:hypothetical protein [Glutamicibacter arilaitensis]|uniref:hypothetical protein n=1 Tax=Glutamicibacter arilaitensis TaxID=256701 RepID=UPI003FD3920A
MLSDAESNTFVAGTRGHQGLTQIHGWFLLDDQRIRVRIHGVQRIARLLFTVAGIEVEERFHAAVIREIAAFVRPNFCDDIMQQSILVFIR